MKSILFLISFFLSIPVLAQMPAVDSACSQGNAGSFDIGDIGSGEVSLLVCDKDAGSGGVKRKWLSKTGSGDLTVTDLTVTGTCTNCGGGSGGGAVIPTDIKLSSSTHDGNFTDYSSFQSWIESNGCSGYRVCSSENVVRYLLAGNNLPSGSTIAWNAGGFQSVNTSGTWIKSCLGWSSASSSEEAHGWQLSASNTPYPTSDTCDTANYVLCCSF